MIFNVYFYIFQLMIEKLIDKYSTFQRHKGHYSAPK